MVRCLFCWPGVGNQMNSVFRHCCLAWTLVEDDTELIQQRQQLGTLLWSKVVQLQTSKLVFSRTLHRSINNHYSNGQHMRSIPWYELTHEVSMNSPTQLPAVRGTSFDGPTLFTSDIVVRLSLCITSFFLLFSSSIIHIRYSQPHPTSSLQCTVRCNSPAGVFLQETEVTTPDHLHHKTPHAPFCHTRPWISFSPYPPSR